MEYTEELKLAVWKNGLVDQGYNPDMVRKDACGAWIVWNHYGKDTPFGWEIDHIFPKSKLVQMGVEDEKIDRLVNLRPLNIANNRSKADSYPSYTATITSEDTHNIKCSKQLVVSSEKQEELRKLYNY